MKSREYILIRSSRRTIGFEVNEEGLIVRAPRFVARRQIEKLIDEREAWISERIEAVKQRQLQAEEAGLLTDEDMRRLAKQARAYIPERVKHYAPIIGVEPGRITIRTQKTKWGSCSAKGNLNFNCLLMLTPEEVIDSIVVHELCHLKEMNHSRRFYGEVLKAFPEYWEWNRWLKEQGGIIMRRCFY